ncbi:MAG: 3-hydroxyacyl-CoA dehydrogenase NAD-binding domain-containing protein [Pseudomonadota bacterium]
MSNFEHWKAERDGDNVLWLGIDKKDSGANVLSGPVLRELDQLIDAADENPPAALIVHSLKKSGFVMGADINEFTVLENEQAAYGLVRLGQQVLDRLENATYPTVAAIDGFALGGGLELAMACHYRVAAATDKGTIGLPEVKLGIHPGFGGTVRAVRLAGVTQAMPLMLTGKSITPAKALKLNLVDRVVARDALKNEALSIARSRPSLARAALGERLMNFGPLRGFLAGKMRAQTRAKANPSHYPSPFAIIDLWHKHGASTSTGYEAEARSIAHLMVGDTAQNLVRVFFLQNALKGQGNRPATKIERVHVVGAGVMGGDIAAWCALRGLHVSLQDREMKYVEPALARAQKLFERKARGDAEKLAASSARLVADIDGNEVANADLIIEAIYENLEAKQTLYAALVPKMKDGAILATNTSSIPIETLRESLPAPHRFIGLHFFNPVAQLPLVEVIGAEATESDALDIGLGFVKQIGKSPLLCRSAPGFVVNRILAPYMGEAFRLAREGFHLASIDKIAVEFGMPMGPVELADTVGLDVGLSVARILGTDDAEMADLIAMVDAGDKGRKTGKGFYEWVDGKAVKPAAAGEPNLPDDVTDRLILPMVNEAVLTLHERVVDKADLLDAGIIFGTGFAPFRGGPLNYCRARGTANVRARLTALAEQHGPRFAPQQAAWDAFEALAEDD